MFGMLRDPVDASLSLHEIEEERYLESLPVCSCCEEPIQSDITYVIDGEYFCEECGEEWLHECAISTESLVD